MQYTPTHLKDQKTEHTYPHIKQWTIVDLQESPDHSVIALQGREAIPWCEEKIHKERRQLKLEMSLCNNTGTM